MTTNIKNLASNLEQVCESIETDLTKDRSCDLVGEYLKVMESQLKLLSNMHINNTSEGEEIELLSLALKSIILQNRFFWQSLVYVWDENPEIFDEAVIHEVESNCNRVRDFLLEKGYTKNLQDYAW